MLSSTALHTSAHTAPASFHFLWFVGGNNFYCFLHPKKLQKSFFVMFEASLSFRPNQATKTHHELLDKPLKLPALTVLFP